MLNVVLNLCVDFVAPGAERVFTPSGEARERRQGSEEVKNREGVAAGGAT